MSEYYALIMMYEDSDMRKNLYDLIRDNIQSIIYCFQSVTPSKCILLKIYYALIIIVYLFFLCRQ